jgi:uncharacterized protein
MERFSAHGMNRSDLILACFAASGGKTFTPVQMQKLLFLIDKRMPEPVGGPHFNFRPYDYGPFDPAVYSELEKLGHYNLIEIEAIDNRRWKQYRPLPAGLQRGKEVLNGLAPRDGDYFCVLAEYVTNLSFAELVGAIYKAYPEMRENSVFQGC